MDMSVSSYVLPVLTRLKNLDACCTGGSLGSDAGLDDTEERKISGNTTEECVVDPFDS